jgi:hypothetical protein
MNFMRIFFRVAWLPVLLFASSFVVFDQGNACLHVLYTSLAAVLFGGTLSARRGDL